jgi:hypothetical protein
MGSPKESWDYVMYYVFTSLHKLTHSAHVKVDFNTLLLFVQPLFGLYKN